MDNKDFFDGMFDFNGDGKTDLMEEGACLSNDGRFR